MVEKTLIDMMRERERERERDMQFTVHVSKKGNFIYNYMQII